MEVINSRQLLNRTIKMITWDEPEDNIEFPKILYFCEGLGEPTFQITIEKITKKVFVDKNGDKWVKQEKK